jgi:Flp pilus assembly protein TadG
MKQPRHRLPSRQLGAVVIEFAFLFVIFLGVLYGIFSYALVMMLQQGLVQAAAEGARATHRIDPLNFSVSGVVNSYQTAAGALASDAAKGSLDWLPTTVTGRITVTTTWTTVKSIVHSGTGTDYTISTDRATVVVTYPDYATAPLLPIMELPGLGPIPQTPKDLIGQAIS